LDGGTSGPLYSRCLLNRRLSALQSWFGRTGEEKYVFFLAGDGTPFPRGGLVFSRAGMDVLEKRNMSFSLPGMEPHFLGEA